MDDPLENRAMSRNSSLMSSLRMIPNLMLIFDFNCLEHSSTEKPKSCNGSAKKKIID